MSLTSYFSPDYATARERFLAAAGSLGARVDSYRFNAKGPSGEPLTMDVATFGEADPEDVVIVSSGLHGVEGFFGSAVQLAWLMTRGAGWSPPSRISLVIVHALNPFGFAWRRRWNQNNVDLNRNFLDDRRFLDLDFSYQESRAIYARLSQFLNPASPPSRWEPYSIKASVRVLSEGFGVRSRMPKDHRPSRFALKAIRGLGLSELRKTLPVGQYENPTGLFYGGAEVEETTRVVRERLPQWVAGAGKVVHVDFHTGLGPYADYRLLIIDERGSDGERWVAEKFGEDSVEAWDGGTAYAARGLMANDLRDHLPGCQYHGLTAEFGTYSAMRVIGALRAENQAHFYSRPGARQYEWAKRRVMEAFCPSAARWRKAVVIKGLAIIDQAVAACVD